MLGRDVGMSKIQELQPVMHIPVNGVSASNQRLNLAQGLVQSVGSRDDAQKQVDRLFNDAEVEDQNTTAKSLGGDVISNTKVQENFRGFLKEGYPQLDGLGLGLKNIGPMRVPAVEVKQAELTEQLTPELVKKAKEGDKENFGLPFHVLWKHGNKKQEDQLGSGKLNDAIIQNHLRSEKPDTTVNVVDDILKDYVNKNPQEKVEQEQDVKLNEVDGNGMVINTVPKEENETFIKRNLLLIVIVVIGMMLLTCCVFGVCHKVIKIKKESTSIVQ